MGCMYYEAKYCKEGTRHTDIMFVDIWFIEKACVIDYMYRTNLSRCLMTLGLSMVTPDVGRRTGSFISSFVTGSRNSSGA